MPLAKGKPERRKNEDDFLPEALYIYRADIFRCRYHLAGTCCKKVLSKPSWIHTQSGGELAGGDHFLFAVYFRDSHFCCGAGPGKGVLGKGPFVGMFVRFFYLCNLRFNQYGHHKELAAKGCGGRYLVGYRSLRNRRFQQFHDRQTALVKENGKAKKNCLWFS